MSQREPTPTFAEQLERLPSSYAGPTRVQSAPYGLIGLGEGALAAGLCEQFVPRRLTASGTQFVLESREVGAAAADYAQMAEVSGAEVVRVGSAGGDLGGLGFLVPGGVLSTYHSAQYVAYASGNAEAAAEAERLLSDLAARCAPHVQEANPARDLAWSLWTRTPLLLAPLGDGWLTWAWQVALARVGKSLSVPVEHDPLTVVSSAFEARHESGDGRLALILGAEDDEMALARELLSTRIDEVLLVPYPDEVDGYAGQLALWYLALWTGFYLAERYGMGPEDGRALREVQASLISGEPAELN